MRRVVLAAGAWAVLLGASPIVQLPTTQSISPQEKAEGAKAHPDLLAEYGGAYAGPQADYVTRVGRRVAGQSGVANSDKEFTITLLNSPVENAFAIPGGYVYCTRQLMALMNDEAELASVLGHESGHVAAHHAEKRQKAAQRDSMIGGLFQALAGAALGNGTLGQLATKGIGYAVNLNILSYSRKEEFEADDLGVVFINKAGYDPRAASEMLSSLAAQVALDQKLAGSRSTPSWASSHPDPGSRVSRALGRAQELQSRNTYRNNDAFLMSLKGMLYGDDPKQGVIEGQDFKYPAAQFQFTAPSGFQMANGASSVTVAGQSGQANFTGGGYDGNLASYLDGAFKTLGGGKAQVTRSDIVRGSVNGMETASAHAVAQTSGGQTVDVTLVAYAFSPKVAYHFVVITPQGQGLGALAPLTQSFRRMTAAEAGAVRARRVDVVKVRNGDTVASMAARMAYSDAQDQRFRVLNGLGTNDVLTPGRKVKLIVWG